MPSIILSDVKKIYTHAKHGHDTIGVQHINEVIPEGAFLSILGPSGCGKSTLLKLLANLLEPSSGSVLYGNDPISTARLQGKIGYIPQLPSLLPHRTVVENIALPLELHNKQESVDDILNLVRLEHVRNRYPHELSVGMQQRVSLARALVTKPDILLMDEPFSAIDELTREKLQMDLIRIHATQNSTIVFITHSVEEAVFLSQSILCMNKHGEVIARVTVPLGQGRTISTRSSEAFSQTAYELRSILSAQ